MQLHDTHVGGGTSRVRHLGKRFIATATVVALASVGLATTAHATPDDDITDPVLRACVEAALGIGPGDVIVEADVAALTSFTCYGTATDQINDLTGIEYFTGLTYLNLPNHLLTDVGELSHLNAPGLVDLRLNGNRITDLSPISHMTGLTNLTVFSNYNIVDLEPIRNMDQLTELFAYNNSISNLDPIADKTQLTTLRVGNNDLDQSSLDIIAGLSNLEILSVNDLGLTDVSPLAGLTNLTELNVNDNHIADLSPLSGLTLSMFYGSNQTVDLGTVAAGEPHANPVLNLDGAPVELDDLYDNAANTFTPMVGDSSTTWDGDNPGVLFNYDFTGTLTFAAVETIDIVDPALRACINDELGQAPDALIEVGQAGSLTSLECWNEGVNVLDGLEHFTSLQELDLAWNNIEDIEALGSLTDLETVRLHYNDITDVSPLAALDSLQLLGLNSNNVADVSHLGGLTGLTELFLSGNGITDISALENLVNLTTLYVHMNNISGDIEPLAGMNQLQQLRLDGNSLSDISALSGKPDLWRLNIRDNHIADLSVLQALNVTSLEAGDQTLDLGSLPVGSLEPNPVVGPDGWPVPLDDLYNFGTNAFSPAVEGPGSVTWDDGADFSGTLSFTATEAVEFIDIPDAALLECINDELGQGPTSHVTPAQAASITYLDCAARGIADLTGLENLVNLGFFAAPDNDIVDVSPLGALGSMAAGFDLSGNLIEDVSPLASLWVGEVMNLSDNRITDISPLGAVPGDPNIIADGQTVHLGEVVIGEAISNPVVDFNGDPIALSAVYDPATNTFTPVALGAGGTTWDGGDTQLTTFNGTLLFTGVEAPSQEPPASPEDPVDPDDELATTGAPSVTAPLSAATLLLLLGLALVNLRRLRALVS